MVGGSVINISVYFIIHTVLTCYICTDEYKTTEIKYEHV